jgi:hypothetical protein
VIEATARPGKVLTSHATAEAAKMADHMTAPSAAAAHMTPYDRRRLRRAQTRQRSVRL